MGLHICSVNPGVMMPTESNTEDPQANSNIEKKDKSLIKHFSTLIVGTFISEDHLLAEFATESTTQIFAGYLWRILLRFLPASKIVAGRYDEDAILVRTEDIYICAHVFCLGPASAILDSGGQEVEWNVAASVSLKLISPFSILAAGCTKELQAPLYATMELDDCKYEHMTEDFVFRAPGPSGWGGPIAPSNVVTDRSYCDYRRKVSILSSISISYPDRPETRRDLTSK